MSLGLLAVFSKSSSAYRVMFHPGDPHTFGVNVPKFGMLVSNFRVRNTFSSVFAVNFSTSACHSLLSVFYHCLNSHHTVQLERSHAAVGSDCKLCNSQAPFVHTVALGKCFISPKANFKIATNTSCVVLLKMTPGTWHMNEDRQVHPFCN